MDRIAKDKGARKHINVKIKFVFISDTHGLHNSLDLPSGDVLVHSGDVCGHGSRREVERFLEWFDSQRQFKHKIFIAGNHDRFLEVDEQSPTFFNQNYQQERQQEVDSVLSGSDIIYLNDSAHNIEGLKLWGSPITPFFNNWAFNRQRGKEIKKHWDLIPHDTDILITHGPPHGILDKVFSLHPSPEHNVGCRELKSALDKIKPVIHVFGHIHEGYGMSMQKNTLYLNASVVNRRYEVVNYPVVISVDDKTKETKVVLP